MATCSFTSLHAYLIISKGGGTSNLIMTLDCDSNLSQPVPFFYFRKR